MTKPALLSLLLLSCLVAPGAQAANPPAYLHYQGYLTDVEGTPVSGDWTVSFKFYVQSGGGSPFFAETRDVATELGVFSAILGTKGDNPINVAAFQGGEAWLELSVAPKGGQGITLQPRQRVVSHPYALWTAGADQCKQADNALSFGGAAPTAYVTVAAIPELCVTDASLPAKLEALGVGAFDEQALADYLAANGYLPGGASSWDEIADKPVDLLTEGGAAASGLFLMADGSVVATGDLDLGGNALLNVVIQNAAAAEAPEAPVTGQLWYDTDENVLKVYGTDAWTSLGSATGLDCEGCVDDADVNFSYALSSDKGGAALKALALECEGCVTLGSLDAQVLQAGNVGFDDSVAGLGAATVGQAVEALAAQTASTDADLSDLAGRVTTLEGSSGANVNEGNGTVVAFEQEWTVPAAGTVRKFVHLFNPATPKVLAFLHSGTPMQGTNAGDLTINSGLSPNSYAAVQATVPEAGTSVTVDEVSPFRLGDEVLLIQIVKGSITPAGAWETNRISGIVGNTLVLASPAKNRYEQSGNTSGRAQVVKAAIFKDLVVGSGGSITPASTMTATNELKGGVVFIRASNILVKNGGRISADSAGFERGDSNNGSGGVAEAGHSECNIDENNWVRNTDCSGGGGGYNNYSGPSPRAGGGGGGNKTAGQNGTGNSYWGYGGTAKGDAGLGTMHFGGGGGYAYPSSGGHGGGIVVLVAGSIHVESGGIIQANGADGTTNTGSSSYCGGGGGAGGTVALVAKTLNNAGTIQASGGLGGTGYNSYNGGNGGEGWVIQLPALDKLANKTLPSGIQIWVDGANVTAAVGDPNQKGAPAWNNTTKSWGDGLAEWATGELDLSAVASWGLGEHTVELKETGGSGGQLTLNLYAIYPFSVFSAPGNDSCQAPKVLDVMTGPVSFADTTEDTMGKIKAVDDYLQPFCGGSGGPELVYKLELTDWRRLTVDVASAFTPRVYVRKGDCLNGQALACGGAHTVTPDLKTGTYYLFVDGDGNTQKGNFKLEVKAELPAPAANDTCAGASPLVLDDTLKAEIYGVSLFSTDNYLAGCGGTGAADLVYSVEVPNGFEALKATVETEQFAPAVYITNGACGIAAWITCSPNKVATLSWPTAGTYYIVVDGKTAADKGEFTLKVELVPAL
jgi:hypothetical protein